MSAINREASEKFVSVIFTENYKSETNNVKKRESKEGAEAGRGGGRSRGCGRLQSSPNIRSPNFCMNNAVKKCVNCITHIKLYRNFMHIRTHCINCDRALR